jgi:predicted nucleic acid-binding protein
VLDRGSIAIDTNVVIYAFDRSSEIEKRETARSFLLAQGAFRFAYRCKSRRNVFVS